MRRSLVRQVRAEPGRRERRLGGAEHDVGGQERRRREGEWLKQQGLERGEQGVNVERRRLRGVDLREGLLRQLRAVLRGVLRGGVE